ncbi:MAG TPA: sulfurtransferase TusA family protein [Candidatus Krumholzibacterium sp.]|nr:sulfurtransferase TusA family protein [Candidatus Krumholzibacterium sp.]
MKRNSEEKIIARGLKSPGPVLLVKKQLPGIEARFLRVIVSDDESKEELIEFFVKHGCSCETDMAGNDIHVITDLSKFKDVD